MSEYRIWSRKNREPGHPILISNLRDNKAPQHDEQVSDLHSGLKDPFAVHTNNLGSATAPNNAGHLQCLITRKAWREHSISIQLNKIRPKTDLTNQRLLVGLENNSSSAILNVNIQWSLLAVQKPYHFTAPLVLASGSWHQASQCWLTTNEPLDNVFFQVPCLAHKLSGEASEDAIRTS